MSKILCPYVAERTASLEVYHDGFYCFGCGEHGTLEDLQKQIGEDFKVVTLNTRASRVVPFSYEVSKILKLPLKNIRGLDLHCDADSYYIVWPDNSYYKKRLINKEKDKYRSPYKIKKSILEMPGSYRDLLVVEGELNALSAYRALPDFKICSPGSATDFMKYTEYYMQYDFIFLAFDYDTAGCDNAIKLRDYLLQRKKQVFLYPMRTDFNELLTTVGIDAIRREIEKISKMQRNLQEFRAR
jgi:DNA primase